MVAPAYAARRSALAKQFGLGTGSSKAEQAAPEAPHPPIKVVKPTIPIPEQEHTAASVFANFPGDEVPDEAPTAPGGAEKPGRKRFGQQSLLAGRRRAASSGK
jgi:hypothetical protein